MMEPFVGRIHASRQQSRLPYYAYRNIVPS